MHVITADDAAALLRDGDTLLIGGSGSGHAVPDALMEAVARRFGKEGHPRNITSLHPTGLGDRARRGVGHFAVPGLLKRIVCGTLTDAPLVSAMALRDEIEAYSMPQGVTSQLMREMAAGRPGLITRTGLHTFVDPRLGGGRQSPSAKEDLCELVTLGGEDYIWFKPHRIDVCFLRGTTADEDGNISMEQEAVFLEMTSMAQAAHNQGAPVVVQVKRIARAGTLPAKTVKIPGMLVDFVVVEPGQWQTYETEYSPAYAGELKIPLTDIPRLPLDERKVIARRAALELHAGAVCNLGSGIATGIANVAAEEDALDAIVLTNEQGMIGGAPAGGNEAGAARNMAAMIDQPYQFDFYDGGGLDLAFLSFVEADREGNINVSRFEGRITGIGGFVNISQGARKVVFCGTFTAGGLDIGVGDGRLDIRRDGRVDKLVAKVAQLSYSGSYAAEQGRQMMLVTERAVFQLEKDGLVLTEIAPGVDLERDVLARMGFRPRFADTIATMDAACFTDAPLGLRGRVEARRVPHRSARVQAWRDARS